MGAKPGEIVLIIGLPESGKSTFLAALLHCVTDKSVMSTLRLKEYKGEFAPLKKLERQWLECKPVGRTLEADESLSHLSLLHDASGRDFGLAFPDLSGERFNAQWRDRTAISEYADYAKTCTGVVLMINPEKINETPAIEDLPDLALSTEQDKPSDSISIEWNPDETSTQVKLVDILQSMLHLRNGTGLIQLAVVVSLWDTVTARGETPEAVVRKRLPLLHQYIESSIRLNAEYFGVSAQGGDYNTQRDALVKLKPIERIKVVGVQGESHDLSLPVLSALGVNLLNEQ